MSQSRLTPDRVSFQQIDHEDALKLPQITPKTLPPLNKTRFEFTTSPKVLYKNFSLHSIKSPHQLTISESTQPTSVKPLKIKRPINTKTIFQTLELESEKAQKEKQDDSSIYRKRLNTPIQQDQLTHRDQLSQRVIGKEAVDNFYSHYKKIDRVKDINSFFQSNPGTYTSVLSKSEDLALFPAKVGFLRERLAERNDSEHRLKIK